MIAFTSTDINKIFRREMADALEGVDASQPDSESLWKEAEIYQYLTEAVDMLSKVVGGRYKIYRLPVVANNGLVRIPNTILDIRSARLVVAGTTVLEANANAYLYSEIDDYNRPMVGAQAMFSATGSPSAYYVRDYEAGYLHLVPIPAMDDTLEIQCDVTDAILYEADFPLPFNDVEDQRLLLDYMKYLAYTKHDADAENLPRAEMHKKRFDQGALDRESRLRGYRRAPESIRMDW